MPGGRTAKGPRLWLEPERKHRDGRTIPASWCIRDDGRSKRRLGIAPAERGEAEQRLLEYITEKRSVQPGSLDPSRRLTTDVLKMYMEDVVPDHARPKESIARIVRLSLWWGNAAMAMRLMRDRGEATRRMTGHLSDIDTATCKAYMAHVGARRSAAMDLSMLRAAINHAHDEQKISRTVKVYIPDTSRPRERWLTRSEVAHLVWTAWRQARESEAREWEHLRTAVRMRLEGLSAAQIAVALGCSRNTVAGHLWRYDKRSNQPSSPTRTSQHLARFILASVYTGTRKTATLSASFERKPGRGHVDLKTGIWQRQPIGKKVTDKQQPTFPVPINLLSHMRRWKRNGQKHLVEFNGESVKSIDKAFRQLIKDCRLGDDVVVHTLRHTAITWGLQNGMNPWDASGFFGVSQEVLEDVYGHHSPQHLRAAADAMRRRPRE